MATHILWLRSGVGYGLPRFPYRALPLVLEMSLLPLVYSLIAICTGYVLCASFDAAEERLEKRVLKKYKDTFFEVVAVQNIATGLRQQDVIPDGTLDKITHSDSEETALGLLFGHLVKHADVDSLKAFCEVIISHGYKAYPRMQRLGREMKDMLEREG